MPAGKGGNWVAFDGGSVGIRRDGTTGKGGNVGSRRALIAGMVSPEVEVLDYEPQGTLHWLDAKRIRSTTQVRGGNY